MRAYVEMRTDEEGTMTSRAWSFDLAHWGESREAETPPGAIARLQRATGAATMELEEVVEGHDPAFARDLVPASAGQRAATVSILESARRRTLELVRGASADQLSRPSDWVPGVDARGFGSAGELAASFAAVESNVYLPALGFEARTPLPDLAAELEESGTHVRAVVASLPEDLIHVTDEGGEWTSVKLLRMLAWRERSLLPLLERLLAWDR